MTTPTSTSRNTRTEPTAFGAEDFTTGEGLRALLNRLAEGGEDAWVHDPVARDLMEFAADHRIQPSGKTLGRWLRDLCPPYADEVEELEQPEGNTLVDVEEWAGGVASTQSFELEVSDSVTDAELADRMIHVLEEGIDDLLGVGLGDLAGLEVADLAGGALREDVVVTEDAFDAALSALAMAEHLDAIRSLRAAPAGSPEADEGSAPSGQGTNSLSPMPSASDLDSSPDATSSIF